LRDVLASSPDICPGQISWDYDCAEVIADGVVHAIGVCPGLIGATIVVIAVNIERIEIAPILAYVIGLLTMLALSAAYNMCLARQVGSAPLRPLRNAGLGSRALAYLQLVSRTCR
jgi:predicted membrane channel-forming protein YqfA (hemolysin III family)